MKWLFQETYGIYFLEIETGEIERARKPSLNEDTVEYCLIANIIVVSQKKLKKIILSRDFLSKALF